MSTDIAGLRREYRSQPLNESDVEGDPVEQFRTWFNQALESNVPDPNAMALATATRAGRPSVRIVLLKGFDQRGFIFFTNYESRKAKEITENPQGALVLYWNELDRQVRIEGQFERVEPEVSAEYFLSRPKDSQAGAWASPQSQVIADREALEQRLQATEARFETEAVSCPPFWGGFRLRPDTFEFWQGRPSRLHDRLRYRLTEEGGWVIERLAP